MWAGKCNCGGGDILGEWEVRQLEGMWHMKKGHLGSGRVGGWKWEGGRVEVAC